MDFWKSVFIRYQIGLIWVSWSYLWEMKKRMAVWLGSCHYNPKPEIWFITVNVFTDIIFTYIYLYITCWWSSWSCWWLRLFFFFFFAVVCQPEPSFLLTLSNIAFVRGLRPLLSRWTGKGFGRDLKKLLELLDAGSAQEAEMQVFKWSVQ